MRLLYSLLLYLLAPLFIVHLLWRGVRAPAYWQRWPERFGYIHLPAGPRRPLWIHAVSVGEVQACLGMIAALRDADDELPVLVTTTTPTGSQRLLEAAGKQVQHVYAPYDFNGAVARFLERARPCAAIVMETELWPNIYHQCHERRIPVIVANARMSERSERAYRRWRSLTRQTLSRVSAIAAQSQVDADRLVGLGADRACIHVTGSVKFDMRLPASVREEAAVLRRSWGVNRRVWIAASTHSGEEEQILEAFRQIRRRYPDALLVIVPRHPERFARVADLCLKAGMQVVNRTEYAPCAPDTAVFIGDTMGELLLFYAASDVAFVGGSLVAVGGQNPLEPAALGLPVIMGPHVFNFGAVTDLLVQAGAARQVSDDEQLADQVIRLLGDANLRHAIGERGRMVVEQNRGALDRLLALVRRETAASCSS